MSKFIATGMKPRLKYWQEQELSRFPTVHPQFAFATLDLEEIFRFCTVHGLDLQRGQAEMFHGHLDYSRTYTDAKNKIFPNASSDCISTEGLGDEDEVVEIWFYPECRRARNEWLALNA
jgi:hypothetical protein